jgi:hypothetical protein
VAYSILRHRKSGSRQAPVFLMQGIARPVALIALFAGMVLGAPAQGATTEHVRNSRIAKEFRESVRKSGLYSLMFPARAVLPEVREQEGIIVVEFKGTNGNTLSATRTPSIESTKLRATFKTGMIDKAAAIKSLKRTERELFTPNGCGINWNSPSSRAAGNATVTTFVGSACNCKAVISQKPGGVIDGLVLSSAC